MTRVHAASMNLSTPVRCASTGTRQYATPPGGEKGHGGCEGNTFDMRDQFSPCMGLQPQPQDGKEKKANPRPRRCAIYITSTEKSYADILKDLISKVKPEEAKAVVRNTRLTNNGGVLLELEKRSEDKEAFQRVIQENLGKQYQVKGLTPRLTLEISGMTSVTTEEVVKAAIMEKVSDIKKTFKKKKKLNMGHIWALCRFI